MRNEEEEEEVLTLIPVECCIASYCIPSLDCPERVQFIY